MRYYCKMDQLSMIHMTTLQQRKIKELVITDLNWEKLEPTPGEFRLEELEQLCQQAEQYDMNVYFQPSVYTLPTWLKRDFPEVIEPKGRTVYQYFFQKLFLKLRTLDAKQHTIPI